MNVKNRDRKRVKRLRLIRSHCAFHAICTDALAMRGAANPLKSAGKNIMGKVKGKT